jgi:hypothetical protein
MVFSASESGIALLIIRAILKTFFVRKKRFDRGNKPDNDHFYVSHQNIRRLPGFDKRRRRRDALYRARAVRYAMLILETGRSLTFGKLPGLT